MKINRNTRVSKVIKENKEAIKVIASLNPFLRLLYVPVLRWLIASPILLCDAAKIGKCNIHELMLDLERFGFELEKEWSIETVGEELIFLSMKVNFLNESKIKLLDLPQTLKKYNFIDISSEILQNAFKKLRNNEVLKIVVDYDPYLLIRNQESKGCKSLTIFNHGKYQVYFKKENSPKG